MNDNHWHLQSMTAISLYKKRNCCLLRKKIYLKNQCKCYSFAANVFCAFFQFVKFTNVFTCLCIFYRQSKFSVKSDSVDWNLFHKKHLIRKFCQFLELFKYDIQNGTKKAFWIMGRRIAMPQDLSCNKSIYTHTYIYIYIYIYIYMLLR